MVFEKNNDPNYFTENRWLTNCGSYALNIKERYCPDEAFALEDYEYAYELVEMENFSEEEAIQIMLERNVEQIKEDFDFLEPCNKDYVLKDGEELIAFRMCLGRTFDEELNTDYHFRVKREGKWMEKCGMGEVQEVKNYNEDPWIISEELIYWGPIAYFVRKCF